MNFIALGIIAEIDNLYYVSLRSFKAKGVFEEENLPVIRKDSEVKKSVSIWIMKGVYQFSRLIFFSFYFYFMPFITIAIT